MKLPLTSPERAANYRALGLWRDQTITERFFAAAERNPDKTALAEANRQFTYRTLRATVENVAGNLLDLGLAPGDVVALQSKNAAELPILHLACNRIGLLYMPLHDSWRETELRELLLRSRARAIIIPKLYRNFDHVAMIDNLRADLPELAFVFTLDGSASGCRSFDDLLQPARHTPTALDARRPDPDLPASIMLSSGTTAQPKMSRYSSNNLLVMVDNFANAAALKPDDVVGALAPAGTGATGYVFPILAPLVYGSTSIVLERWGDPAEGIDLLLRRKCTVAVAIPTQMTQMIPVLEQQRPTFESFRCFTNAGAPLPYETGLQIERLMNCVVQTVYGATDGGAPTMTTIYDSQEKRLRTVGRVARGFDCVIRDASGNALPAGDIGEVSWRGADKSWGYLGDDPLTAVTFAADGFYKSGDLAQLDAEGYLHIVGRAKDMILRGGRNISPRAIEELLINHPSIVEVAVAAMPDPVLGERACAFVCLKRGTTLGFDEMIEFLRAQKVAVWQFPERLELLDDLPRSGGGKIAKNKLTELITAKLKSEGRIPG